MDESERVKSVSRLGGVVAGRPWGRAAELSDLTDISGIWHIFLLTVGPLWGPGQQSLEPNLSVQLLGWELVNNRSQGTKGVFILLYEIIFYWLLGLVFAGTKVIDLNSLVSDCVHRR